MRKAIPKGAPASSAHAGANATVKRLTLDLDPDLHRRIKTSCARRGVKMVDEIRELLQKHFPDTD